MDQAFPKRSLAMTSNIPAPNAVSAVGREVELRYAAANNKAKKSGAGNRG
jgi:hypothetical protein